jgi:two-component sensor histidine kinase
VPDSTLTVQNAYLRKMLEQAGLDAAARDVAEQIQSVLTDEIHHRMKNMLAMVTAIVRQSVRSAPDLAHAEAAISTRLIAMAKAQDLLLKAALHSASLIHIVAGAIDQHNSRERIILKGDDVEVISSSILPLTMILNELCTNATKYGALSKDGGQILLTSTRDEAVGTLTLHWAERDGPTVNPSGARSFGTRLLEDALPRQMGGQGKLTFPPQGVQFELVVPLKSLAPLPLVA